MRVETPSDPRLAGGGVALIEGLAPPVRPLIDIKSVADLILGARPENVARIPSYLYPVGIAEPGQLYDDFGQTSLRNLLPYQGGPLSYPTIELDKHFFNFGINSKPENVTGVSIGAGGWERTEKGENIGPTDDPGDNFWVRTLFLRFTSTGIGPEDNIAHTTITLHTDRRREEAGELQIFVGLVTSPQFFGGEGYQGVRISRQATEEEAHAFVKLAQSLAEEAGIVSNPDQPGIPGPLEAELVQLDQIAV